jgi:serine O-acetyltransferase
LSTIGKNIKLPHPLGIVIGAGVVIKDNVTIFQQVTLGGKGGFHKLDYPIIENNVIIYAGAKILGSVTIGQNSIIGANSVVLSDIPPDSVAVGVPARILKISI